jgi:hypothetical protein
MGLGCEGGCKGLTGVLLERSSRHGVGTPRELDRGTNEKGRPGNRVDGDRPFNWADLLLREQALT